MAGTNARVPPLNQDAAHRAAPQDAPTQRVALRPPTAQEDESSSKVIHIVPHYFTGGNYTETPCACRLPGSSATANELLQTQTDLITLFWQRR